MCSSGVLDKSNEIRQDLALCNAECLKLDKECGKNFKIPHNIAALFFKCLMIEEAWIPNENNGFVHESVIANCKILGRSTYSSSF